MEGVLQAGEVPGGGEAPAQGTPPGGIRGEVLHAAAGGTREGGDNLKQGNITLLTG